MARKPVLAPATISEHDGVRFLHLGTPWVQGAMRIRKPQSLELEYVQRMMAWLLWREIDPARGAAPGHAAQLGLGAAALTRFCHQALRWRCTAVELNPTVVHACRQWFKLPPDDARLAVVQADAGAWIGETAQLDSIDALCVDLYDHEAAAPVLDSAAFYRDCHAALADGGVMSVNLFGRDVSFGRSAGRIAAAFGPEHCAMLRPTKEGNTIVVACKGVARPAREALVQRADAIESLYGLPARKWLRLLQNLPDKAATTA